MGYISPPSEARDPAGGVLSNPPAGSYKVVNIYVDPNTGRLVVEYDDTPAE